VQARYCSLLLVLAGHASRPGQGRARAAITTSHAPRICCWRRNDNPRAEHLHLCLAVTPIRQQPQHACVHASWLGWSLISWSSPAPCLSLAVAAGGWLEELVPQPAAQAKNARTHRNVGAPERLCCCLPGRPHTQSERALFAAVGIIIFRMLNVGAKGIILLGQLIDAFSHALLASPFRIDC
jgi:hypothetical protein